MVWEDYHVNPYQVQARNLDMPMFVGHNVLQYSTDGFWKTSGTGTGTDVTASGAPVRLAYDGRGTIKTMGVATATSTISLIYTLTPLTERFDTVAVIGHNFASIGNLTNVYLEIADSNNFDAGARVCRIADWSTFNTGRLVSTNLYVTDTSFAITGYDRQYGTQASGQALSLRLRLVGSGDLSASPQVGELFVGRRYQMSYKSDLPFSDEPLRSEVIDFVSESGERTRHILYTGAGDVERAWTTGGGDFTGMDGAQTLKDWFASCDNGTRASLYIENPNSAPQNTLMFLPDPPELVIQRVGPYEANTTVVMSELPPFRSSEV